MNLKAEEGAHQIGYGLILPNPAHCVQSTTKKCYIIIWLQATNDRFVNGTIRSVDLNFDYNIFVE